MTKTEILPVVDKTGAVIGQAPRAICHSNPDLIHPVFHLWIFDDRLRVLLQKRSKHKDVYPNHWDISCAGHIGLNETALETLTHELKEELSLDINKLHLHHITNFVQQFEHQTEFVYLYCAKISNPPTSFTLQEEEVSEIKWFKYKDVLSLCKRKAIKVTSFVEMELKLIQPHIDIKDIFNLQEKLPS